MNKIFITIYCIFAILLVGCSQINKNVEHNNEKDNSIKSDIEESTNISYRIIEQFEDSDIDSDGVVDEVIIFYENYNIELKVNDERLILFTVEDEEQIFGQKPSDEYIIDLFVEGNKILVGIKYTGTNKYGSTSWVHCYEYQDKKLNKIWDSFLLQERKIVIDSYEDNDNIIIIYVDDKIKEMIISEQDENEFLEFTSYLLQNGDGVIEMQLAIMPQYVMYDYNLDGSKELITRSIVTFGASSITDSYITIFEFSDNGIKELESYFGSKKPDIVEKIFENQRSEN